MANKSQIAALIVSAIAFTGYILLRKRKTFSNGDTEIYDYSGYGESISRGYRNNNPLNIRISKEPWKHKVSPNTDGSFEQFTSTPYGYRAALITMRTYINKYGLNTVRQIISRWAPENENNTANYINRVCEYSGLKPDTIISANDRDKLTKMAYAMSIVENDVPLYHKLLQQLGLPNMEAIQKGWSLI